jgi:hypothetical protein
VRTNGIVGYSSNVSYAIESTAFGYFAFSANNPLIDAKYALIPKGRHFSPNYLFRSAVPIFSSNSQNSISLGIR